MINQTLLIWLQLLKQGQKYILQEIELHHSLKHPFIIKLYDYFFEDEKAYVILEYAKKGDIFNLINTSTVSEKVLMRMFVQTLTAFDYLHEQNILHRDLKPENVLLDSDLNIKLCDFGWATLYSDHEERNTLCGTLEYMAPEIMDKGKRTR